ncbi:MAG TPA: glycoside hydrolase family 88 protein [Dehalococcoidia bacterium]|nr:glycoside hydrolase family 88 protein [Dehalococcoidia bacterium]
MLDVYTALQALVARTKNIWQLDASGLTCSRGAVPALVHRDAYASKAERTRVLLIGGLSGHQADVELALGALDSYARGGNRQPQTIALSAVPCGNPDGLASGSAPKNSAGGSPAGGYPPRDNFFYDPQNPEARYLWRWAGFHAPDLMLEVRAGDTVAWEATQGAESLAPAVAASRLGPPDSLLAALATGKPNGLAPIPGLRLTTPPEALATELDRLWSALARTPRLQPSPARRALEARRQRLPLEIARLLASAYGHKLDPVVYTQGVAISGRLRLARLDPTDRDTAPDIVRLVEPYLSGAKALFGDRIAPSNLNGLVWADELTQATGDRRYADLLVSAASHYRPGAKGAAPPPSDPDFRTEDMFMNGAVLGRAFRITGNASYLDLLTKFLLTARVQQGDGLFWHSRSTPYYWGRGNGFAALGFAETLTYLPADHPDRDALLAMHVKHLDALRQHQRPSGMLSQVVDLPGSYQELTATCMAGYAMARGMRLGWLDPSWRASAELAWQGVAERIDESGGVVDACTNTGVQQSLGEYLDRPAVFGLDDRGGAMALWFAAEMEQLKSS